jgi:hypothetical protein
MSERDQSRLLLMTRAGTLVLGLAATAALSSTAIAQTQSQKPSQQEPSPPADGALQPDAPSTTEPSLVSGIRLPLIHFPETSGAAEVGKRFGTISPDSGVWALYGDFSGNQRFGRVNPNAPWKVGGRLTYSSANGTVARIGFFGYANSRVPIFMNETIGGGQDLTLPLVSFTDLSQQEMQWVLSAGVEKSFLRFPGIATIGGVADVFVPLNKVSPSIVVPETQAPLSTTPGGGITIGF